MPSPQKVGDIRKPMKNEHGFRILFVLHLGTLNDIIQVTGLRFTEAKLLEKKSGKINIPRNRLSAHRGRIEILVILIYRKIDRSTYVRTVQQTTILQYSSQLQLTIARLVLARQASFVVRTYVVDSPGLLPLLFTARLSVGLARSLALVTYGICFDGRTYVYVRMAWRTLDRTYEQVKRKLRSLPVAKSYVATGVYVPCIRKESNVRNTQLELVISE